MYKESVKEYFKNKAEEYDLVDNQIYWVLSDMLLWDILKKHVLDKIGGNIEFVDAGAGTGRWSKKILDAFTDSQGLMIDLSEDMLRQARMKLEKSQEIHRVSIIQSDLDKFDDTQYQDKFNVAFSFHNVLGFVKDPEMVIRKMYNMVKSGGYVVCAIPNYYHNIFFNILVQNLELAEECVKTNKGRFTKDMPVMNMFTPNGLRETFNNIGLKVEGIYGFPNAIYPGMQETQLQGQTKSLSDILSDSDNFKRIYDIEKQLYINEEATSRGNQIIIIGRK